MATPCCLAFVAVVSSAVSFAVPARAQLVGTDSFERPRKTFASPQRFAFEARFAAFWPEVDSDPALNGKTPFGDLYGKGPQLLAGAEFDWEALRIPHLGTLGPGLGVAYMKASTKAPYETAQGTQTISGEDTALEIIPFYGVATLRADVFLRDFHVPLVPWVKLGVGYALWRASNTLGTASYKGVTGEGHTLGTHLALGLGLNLNFLDPDTAQEFDNSLGVNGTYLFAEWTREDLTGLGTQSGPMRVGGSAWTFGFAFEF
ncbi:MAG: MXAN_2562 family outer membrane beta-barrel protein [Polyangiaceae bacterium]